jgi:hypothetical protein
MLAWKITSATNLKSLKSSTKISHTHNRSRKTCVWSERALKSQVFYSNGQKRYLAWDGWVFIAHIPKTSRWKVSAHLAVKLQFNLWSDHHSYNGYFHFWNLTIRGAGSLTGLGGSQTALEQRVMVWPTWVAVRPLGGHSTLSVFQ